MSDTKPALTVDPTMYAKGFQFNSEEDFKEWIVNKQIETEERLRSVEGGMSEMRNWMSANMLITAESKSEIKEALEILRAAKGAIKVVGVLGSTLKWLAAVGAAIVALYGIATGNLPWPK